MNRCVHVRRSSIVVGLSLSTLLTSRADGQGSDSTRRAIVRGDSARVLRAVEVRASVTGRGQARAVNAVSRLDLQLTPAGSSPLRAVEKLPGVNFQTADPFGLYEWANRVTMRGFQTQQVGQTFDGITLGDMSYGNFNGLGIGRAVDADNLVEASVAQGSGALGTASSNNLGGVVQYVSADPANERGIGVRQMFGGANARRTGVRFETGLVQRGNIAFKSYLSFSRYDTDKWKGGGERFSPVTTNGLFGQSGFLGRSGEQWMDQVNWKAQVLRGPHKFTAFYNFADKKEADYADLSLARFNSRGRDWDQFSDWGA
ncbi:MAG: Plug domain-containing protein, partial [Gemmatimonadaceae bacterium]